MIETICPECSNVKTFSDDKIGRKFKCPTCGETVLIEGNTPVLPVQATVPAITYIKNIVSEEDRLQDIIEERVSNNAQKHLKLLKKSKTWNGWGIAFYVLAGIALLMVLGGEPAQLISVGFWGGLGYWFQKKAKTFKEQAAGMQEQISPGDKVHPVKQSPGGGQSDGSKIEATKPS